METEENRVKKMLHLLAGFCYESISVQIKRAKIAIVNYF